MTRPLRHEYEDAWYHVFSRGLERREIFADDRDRDHFLELVEEMRRRYRVRIHAWVLMDNHYHGIFQTPDANLSAGMQWFHGSYSAWYNARHNRVGPLFQGRYRAIPMEDGGWAYDLSFYVHLNPLRIRGLGLDKNGRVEEAKGYREPTQEQVVERLKRLREYRWSSYRAYAGYQDAPKWLETGEILRRTGAEKDKCEEQYREDAKERLTCGVDPTRTERLRDAVAIGSEQFAKRMRKVSDKVSLRGVADRRELRRRVRMEDVRKAVEELKGEPWEAFAGRHGDWGLLLFLWGARRFCSVTLRELGAVAGGKADATVGMAIKRFELRSKRSGILRRRKQNLLEMLDVKP
jgi:REP element-mobilizing transposase RayT